jgi:hypothetical protein
MTLPPTSKKSLQLHFEAKKIRDYEAFEFKQLHLTLLALCKLVGITEAPDDGIIKLLIEHLQEHHKDFSKEEITRAFSLATAGKLNFEFVHYNRITPQLLSLTLNKYKEQRNKDLTVFNREQDRARIIAESNAEKPSDEELQSRYIKSSLELFERYRRSRDNPNEPALVPFYDYGNMVYKFLDRINCIKISNEEKNELYKEALKSVIENSKFRKTSTNDLKKIREEAQKGESFEVATEAMQIALLKFFEDLYDSEIELNVLIDNVLADRNNV